MAVLAPMPSASDSTATAVKTGDFNKARILCRRSWLSTGSGFGAKRFFRPRVAELAEAGDFGPKPAHGWLRHTAVSFVPRKVLLVQPCHAPQGA